MKPVSIAPPARLQLMDLQMRGCREAVLLSEDRGHHDTMPARLSKIKIKKVGRLEYGK